MSTSGSPTKADYLRSGFSGLLPFGAGDPALIRAASSSSPSLSSPALRCRSMTRLRPFWRLCVRGFLLAIVTAFALRLTLAEVHYARGWSRSASASTNLSELQTAAGLYPFVRRFREGPAMWEWVVRAGGR